LSRLLRERKRKALTEAEQTGVLQAPARLKERLDAIDANLQRAQMEANGHAAGLIVGAADALDIEYGRPNWDYDRETNTFRRYTKLPDGRVLPPGLDPKMEIRPPAEVSSANGDGTKSVEEQV
jgi:hypothetical protein